jgi:hypothetical protein
MDEEVWLASSDPVPMLGWLSDNSRASGRKHRLFAVACCRRIWHLISDPHCRKAIEGAEKYADGRISGAKLAKACKAIYPAGGWNRPDARSSIDDYVTEAAFWASQGATAFGHFGHLAARVAEHVRRIRDVAGEAMASEEGGEQAGLIRDIFGSPFGPVVVDPTWLTWNDGLVLDLARGIYVERAFEQMPIFGDALEDAGCTDGVILEHCRSRAEHVRGCWVVDALLGKG